MTSHPTPITRNSTTAPLFWQLHMVGWAFYTLLSATLDFVYRFPLHITFLECGVYFVLATAVYYSIATLERSRLRPYVQLITDHFAAMLVFSALVGFMASLLWSWFALNYLMVDFIKVDPFLSQLTLFKAHEYVYFCKANDGVFAFCIWGGLWQTAKLSTKPPAGAPTRWAIAASFAVPFVLIFMKALANNWRPAHHLNWSHLSVSIASRFALLALLLFWAVKIIVAKGAAKQRVSPLQAYSIMLVFMLILAIPAVVLLDAINFDLAELPLLDLVSRALGAGPDFLQFALLLGIVWLYHFLPRQQPTAIQFETFPRSLRFWINNLLAWLLLGALTLLLEFRAGAELEAASILYTLGRVAIFGGAWSLIARLLILNYDWALAQPYRLVPRLTAIAVMMGLMLAVLDAFAEAILQGMYFQRDEYTGLFSGSLLQATQGNLPSKYVLFILWFFLWAFTYSYFVAYDHKMTLTLDRLQLQNDANLTRLSLINRQLDPNFIFNALEQVHLAIDENPQAARESVSRLGSLLRKNLSPLPPQKIPLQEELAWVHDYLQLYAAQFPAMPQLIEQVNPHCLHALVPPKLVFTLIENALRFGDNSSASPGFIGLVIDIENTRLEIVVNFAALADMASDVDANASLDNLRASLQAVYGELASLEYTLTQDSTKISVWLPMEGMNENSSH